MTTGYLLAVLTGVLFGVQGAYGKAISKYFDAPFLAWANFAFTVPFVLFLLFLSPIPEVDWVSFVWSTMISFMVNLIAWILFFRALSLSPLYLTMPFTALTPLFTIPIAFFLLGELPDFRGVIGILLIIAGVYSIQAERESLIAPFLNLFKEKGTRLMLIVAVIWSLSATVEKVAVQSSSPQFYAVTIHLLLAVAYFPYVYRKHPGKMKQMTDKLLWLIMLGAISGTLAICQFTALKYLDVSYVIAFKRAGVMLSVFLGFVFFGEKRILLHLLATGLIISGALMIMF